MKKVTATLLIVLSSLSLFAQAPLMNAALQLPIAEHDIGINPRSHTISASAGQVSGWVNYGEHLDSILGNAVTKYYLFLFPDSTVKVNYSNGIGYVGYHSIGQTLDVTSPNVNYPLDSTIAYTLDSVGFWYRYTRPQDGAPDTILIQLYEEAAITRDPDPWADNRSYANVKYDYTKRIGKNATHSYTITINNSDTTATGFKKWMGVATNLSVPAGNIVAASVTYFPGNPFAVNDTIDLSSVPTPVNKRNNFTVYNYKDSTKTFNKYHYNNELRVPTSVRYNINTNGWNGQYIAGSSWNAGIYHMDMDFHITTINLSASSRELSAMRSDIFPNPVISGTDASAYLYVQGQQEVRISLFDITGKQTGVAFTRKVIAGLNQISIPTSKLAKGIYLCKFEGEKNCSIKKLVLN